MKLLRRTLMVLVAMLVGLAVGGTSAYAAGTGTITVAPPSGTESDVQTTYNLYKVFVAQGNETGITYKTVNSGDVVTDTNGNILTHSKGWALPDVAGAYKTQTGTDFDSSTLPSFVFDTTGVIHWATINTGATSKKSPDNLSDTYEEKDLTDVSADTLPDYAITAIWNYITAASDSPIQTKSTTGTQSVTFEDVDNGYYYVTTTTGTAVSVTTANPNASISDKSVAPTIDKVITAVSADSAGHALGSIESGGKRAIAAAGSTVTYQATVTFNRGATNVVLHDTLDSGLRLVTTEADKPTVSFTSGTGSGAARYAGGSSAADTNDTLTVDFAGVSGNGGTATVTYKATVVSDTLTSQYPAKNAAYLTYGTNSPLAATAKSVTSVYNGTYTVSKVDNAGQPLAGAGFVLFRTDLSSGLTRYYYHQDASGNVSWVPITSGETSGGVTTENAAKNAVTAGTITLLSTTASNGDVVTFEGLPDGSYELYELYFPTGYAQAEDVQFTISSATAGDDSFTAANLEQTQTVRNVPGSQLPGTGGRGTLLLYVAGAGLIVGGLAIGLGRRRRAA